MKIAAVMAAATIQARLRGRVNCWLGILGTSLDPRHCVIHAMPEDPPNEDAAAEIPTRIIPTGLNSPATV